MTDSKMPERIWASAAKQGYGEWQDVVDGLPRPTEYIRADLAHPDPVADAELEGWRYEVKEGPNGEQVYAWVYDETGKMVATMKFEHAVKLVTAIRARTAQPVGVQPPFVDSVMTRLRRFYDCAEDREGVDIGREWLDTLTALGLIERAQRSPARWQLTDAGLSALLPEGGA